ncbi:MAG: HD domain-containing protein [Dehalococcoidales bacterium]|nr:HD domain-containing protein [Dehalococcoidales bacterium]
MIPYLFIPIVEIIFSAALLMLLMISGQRHIARRPFSLYLVFMGLWGFFIFKMRAATGMPEALVWEKFVFWSILSAALVFYHFTIALTGTKPPKLIVYPIYFAYTVFTALIPTGLVFSGLQTMWYGKAPIIGPLFFPFVLSIYAPIALSLITLLKHRRRSRIIDERVREQYIIAGIVVMFVGGTTDFLPSLGIAIYPLGIIGNILFCILATVAMLRYGLLEIRVVLRKGATYSLASMLIFGVFGSLLFLLSKMFQELLNPFSLVITVAGVFVVAAVFQPVLSRMQRTVDRWFFRQRYDHIEVLKNFTEETRSNLELKQLASSLVSAIANAMQSQTVHLLFSASSSGNFITYSNCGQGCKNRLVVSATSPLATTLGYRDGLIDTNDIDIIPSLGSLPASEKQMLAHNNIELIMPLNNNGRLIGILLLAGKISREPYTNEERQLLKSVTVKIAPNMENASRYERMRREHRDLQQAMDGIIYAVSLIVETRDPYTAGHQRRVAELARLIAKEMGLSDWQVKGVHIAGLLHDVGKIAVPSEILSKPGKLSQYEFSLIKNHSQVGYEILGKIEFPWPVTQAILQHHERLNGTGYPHALAGTDIIIEAKILAVADVVEAMSSHRPYRPALGVGAALEEISRGKDTLYDPEVVDACTRLLRKEQQDFDKLIAEAGQSGLVIAAK